MIRISETNYEHQNLSMSAIFIDKVHPCVDCPMRQLAARKPQSIFAAIHNWHKTWWPGWKAHQARLCPRSAGMTVQAEKANN